MSSRSPWLSVGCGSCSMTLASWLSGLAVSGRNRIGPLMPGNCNSSTPKSMWATTILLGQLNPRRGRQGFGERADFRARDSGHGHRMARESGFRLLLACSQSPGMVGVLFQEYRYRGNAMFKRTVTILAILTLSLAA